MFFLLQSRRKEGLAGPGLPPRTHAAACGLRLRSRYSSVNKKELAGVAAAVTGAGDLGRARHPGLRSVPLVSEGAATLFFLKKNPKIVSSVRHRF